MRAVESVCVALIPALVADVIAHEAGSAIPPCNPMVRSLSDECFGPTEGFRFSSCTEADG